MRAVRTTKILMVIGAAMLLVGGVVGCIEDAQSLMVTNAVWLDPDNECEVEVDMTASSGSIRLEVDTLDTGTWDIGIRGSYTICPEILNLLQETREVYNLKGESNMVTLESYEVRYDWGEDLGFDLGPGSIPWELGITDRYREMITVTIPPGGRYITCVPLVPREVGERVAAAKFWEIPLNHDDPDDGRRYAPSFRTIIRFYGTTTGGREIKSNEFMFRVSVEEGWLFLEPNEAECCETQPQNLPCIPGQDSYLDCRAARGLYDSIFPPVEDVDGDGKLDSRCCPFWPTCL